MAASSTPSDTGIRTSLCGSGHDRTPSSRSSTSGECSDSLRVAVPADDRGGAVNIEFSTASSVASTTAANRSFRSRPVDQVAVLGAAGLPVEPQAGAEAPGRSRRCRGGRPSRCGRGPRPTRRASRCAGGAVDRGVGDDHADAGAGRLGSRRVGSARRQQPADGHAGDDQLLADAEVRHQQHADGVALRR